MGVAYNPPGEAIRVDHIDPASPSPWAKAALFWRKAGMARVSLGVLDDCNEVVIRDEAGTSPEEHLGTITVCGTNVMKGY